MNIPGIPPLDVPDEIWNMGYQFRESYCAVKYRVSERFKPSRICEIGVWSGIAAMCFLAASPTAEYVGIDSACAELGLGMPGMIDSTRAKLIELGYKSEVIIADSQAIDELPGQFDFIHVDADHSRKGACHDMVLAWKACTPTGHILIDNGHNMDVCAGVFDALHQVTKSLLTWEYLPDSVGNILIHREPFANLD